MGDIVCLEAKAAIPTTWYERPEPMGFNGAPVMLHGRRSAVGMHISMYIWPRPQSLLFALQSRTLSLRTTRSLFRGV